MEILIEALNDTIRLLPFLAFIYLLVAFLECRYGEKMGHFVMKIGVFGPVVGALFGCLPQCGFSVVASALYVKRLVSLGTLLAVFLSTSDEALPVLLAMPEKAGMVGVLIILKLCIAIFAGLILDIIFYKKRTKGFKNNLELDKKYHEISECHKGCCSHELSDRPNKLKTLLLHPLLHTIKIFAFLFIFSIALGFIFEKIGEEKIKTLLLGGTFLQPLLASLIGLIPNCLASVLLAQLYVKAAISFGSLVAGLCASAGLGILVLAKENKDLKDTIRIIAILLGISIVVGILIQLIS